MTDHDGYLTPAEAAEELGLTRQKLWRLRRERNITVYRRGLDRRRRYYRREDVEALRKWLEGARAIS